MKFRFKQLLIAVFALMLALLVGCSDGKKPMEGYISRERVNEIISTFKAESLYAKYSINGSLNYFEMEEELVPRTVNKRNLVLTDSLDAFVERKSGSYYLDIPLHITSLSWNSEQKNSQGLSLSTQYQLESKVYRPAGLDSIYYYEAEDGGLILRAFGVNKPLVIKNPSDITCRAKWNIEIVYDKNGYLVSEKFETLNAHNEKNSESCYGQATYTYSN